MIADLSIQCAGAATVGIYATSAWPQVHYVVDHSEARLLFVENEEQLDKWLHFQGLAKALERVIVWDTEGLRAFSDPRVLTFDALLEQGRKALAAGPTAVAERMAALTPDDVALLIYREPPVRPRGPCSPTATSPGWPGP